MAPLKNLRQERFCQLLKQGIPPYRAYPMAGYKLNGGSPYRLQENARIETRLKEIGRHMSRKTEYTIEKALLHLEEDRQLARSKDQPGAAIQATQLAAKLVGLLVDRKETGAPGDFANLETPEQVLEAIGADMGKDAADLARAFLGRLQAAEDAGQFAEVDLVDDRKPGDALN